jgi:hypothetical protein
MLKVSIKYYCWDLDDHSYEIELSDYPSISFLDKKKLLHRRRLTNLEIFTIYNFLETIDYRINRDEYYPSLICPHIEKRLKIKSKTLKAEFLWDNGDWGDEEKKSHTVLNELTDYIEAMLTLEEMGIERPPPLE